MATASPETLPKEELVEKLRQLVTDIWRPEFADCHYMEKWMIARDWDLIKAETMLRNHVMWRAAENVDTILLDYEVPEVYQQFGVGSFYGHDKEGRPIWWEPLGHMDPQGIMKSIPYNEILKIRVYYVEHLVKHILPQRSQEEGRPISQTIAIFDLEKFSRKHLWIPVMNLTIEATKSMEANYPESMAKLIIFNASTFFKLAYAMVKPFLAPATQKKVCVLGHDFKEQLLTMISADQLPAYLGGNATVEGDPRCAPAIKWGGTVPARYYLNSHQRQMQQVVVRPHSKFKMSYFVPESDAVLYYEYSTRDHDISFGIYFVGPELPCDANRIKSSHCQQVLCLSRTHSNLIIEKGELSSLERGYYLIEFDNSYSWTKPKHVQYHIEVLDVVKADGLLSLTT